MAHFIENSRRDPGFLFFGGFIRLMTALRRDEALIRMFQRSLTIEKPKRKAFRGYAPTEQDVFVATFMKSGTNWMMQICQQIAWRGAAEFEHILAVAPWPELPPFPGCARLHDPAPAPSPTGKRVIKTHLEATHVPVSDAASYVIVLRDPKEVFVSSYHFMLGLMGIRDRVPASLWLKHFLNPRGIGGAWATHAATWWALRERANVLVLRFGAMKRDLPGHVDQVAALMGVALAADERAAVIERASVQHMRAHELQFAPPIMPFIDQSQRPVMVRKGKTGASSELLSREQQLEIDAFARERIQALEPALPYDEWFDPLRD